jgi:hypothetical protein
MKFNIGDHLQEIDSIQHGIVVHFNCDYKNSNDENWYQIENEELGLVNHWVPEYKLELHKQTLREAKLNELGI